MLSTDALDRALAALGEVLADRKLAYELVAVGGGALALVGLIERSTRDLDIVGVLQQGALAAAVELPAPLAEAVGDVARALDLSADWVNGDPARRIRELPEGFLGRCSRREFGPLVVWLASRVDQIYLKLYAAVDDRGGGKHVWDLETLQPTKDELRRAAAWARTQDGSETFARMLRACLGNLEAWRHG